MPYLMVAALSAVAFGCVGLAKHPIAERLICLAGPVGMTLCCVSHWRQARTLLAGSRCSWTQSTLLLALTVTGSGQTLGDMYHRKDMGLFILLGTGVLVVAAICLALLGAELFGDWQAEVLEDFAKAAEMDIYGPAGMVRE